jgi:hypothetical protein
MSKKDTLFWLFAHIGLQSLHARPMPSVSLAHARQGFKAPLFGTARSRRTPALAWVRHECRCKSLLNGCQRAFVTIRLVPTSLFQSLSPHDGLPAVTCPPNAAGIPCLCSPYHVGNLLWDAGAQTYTGTCTGTGVRVPGVVCALWKRRYVWASAHDGTAAPCPASSSGFPCTCNTGFSAALLWNASSQAYAGVCACESGSVNGIR